MTDLNNTDMTGDIESASGTLRRVTGEGCCETAFPANRSADGDRVERTVSVFKALANEKRVTIVEALRGGELCACELETVLDAPQSTVASHLSELRDAGIVATRKDGKWTYYRIADTASLQLVDLAAALGEDA